MDTRSNSVIARSITTDSEWTRNYRFFGSGTVLFNGEQPSGCACTRVLLYPLRIRRSAVDLLIAPSPPIRIHPSKAVSYLRWLTFVEVVESTIIFAYTTFFLFQTFRMPPSEIREKLNGWLTMAVVVCAARSCLASMLLEQLRALYMVREQHDIRSSLIEWLTSVRLASSRWLQFVSLLWFLWGWQVVWAYNHYRSLVTHLNTSMTPDTSSGFAPGSPGSNYIYRGGPYLSGSMRVTRRPILTDDPAEIISMQILAKTVWLSLFALIPYTLHFLGSGLLYMYRKYLSHTCWLALLTPSDLEILPPAPLAGRNSAVVTPDVLCTFPWFAWDAAWVQDCSGSQISSTNSQNSKHNDAFVGMESADIGCTICLSQFSDAEFVRLLPCGHPFHRQCIDNWVSAHATCPMRCSIDLQLPFNRNFRNSVLSSRLPKGLREYLLHIGYEGLSLDDKPICVSVPIPSATTITHAPDNQIEMATESPPSAVDNANVSVHDDQELGSMEVVNL